MNGAHYNMPDAEYRAAPGVSISALKSMKRSPAHYQWNLTHPREDTKAFQFGRVFESMVFFPNNEPWWVVQPEGLDFRTAAGKAWKAQNADKVCVSQDDMEAINTMMAQLKANDYARACLSGAAFQAAWFRDYWIEKDVLRLKGLVDIVTSGEFLVDLKTCQDASAAEFAKDAHNFGYLLQAAYYLDGWNSVCSDALKKKGFAFLVCEKTAPYLCAIYYCREQELDMGRQEYMKLLRELNHCNKENKWPGYPDLAPLVLPPWAYRGVS